MLDRIFPKSFDNVYRGNRLGLWLFAGVALVKALQGINSMVFTRMVATGADGIPLDRFNAEAAETVLRMFGLLGFYTLVLPLLSAVALVRYRAMIPFLFLMLLFVQIGSRVFLLLKPIARTSAVPPGLAVNLAILAVTLVGFALSLRQRK